MAKLNGSINQVSAGNCRRWERIKRELEEMNCRIKFAEQKGRIARAIEMIDSLMVEEALGRMEEMGRHI